MRFSPAHIRQGKTIVRKLRQYSWELSDLLAAVAPPGDYPKNGSHQQRGEIALRDILIAFAEEIGLDFHANSLIKYRATSIAWPEDRRVDDCSFSVHLITKGAPDRFDLVRPGMTSKEALTAIGTTQPEYLKGGRHTYETAIAKLKGSISLKKSAAKTIGYLSLTNEQIFYIGSLVGADADALDLVIEAADLQVEEAVA